MIHLSKGLYPVNLRLANGKNKGLGKSFHENHSIAEALSGSRIFGSQSSELQIKKIVA